MLESDENIRLSPDKLFSKILRLCFAKHIKVSDRIISSWEISILKPKQKDVG